MNIQCLVLVLCCVLPYVISQCPTECKPIVLDGLFQKLGTNANESAWKIQPYNTPSISITSTPIIHILTIYSHGYNFVVFQSTLESVQLYQSVIFPILPTGKSLWLEFYLFVKISGRSVIDTLTVSIDGTVLASFSNFYAFSEGLTQQRYNVSQFADGGAHILTFSSVSTSAKSSTQFYLDAVTIYPLHDSLLNQIVYVSNTGNDLSGTGSSIQPFCSLRVALEAIAPGNILFIQSGIYCEHAIEINKSQLTILGLGSPQPIVDLQDRWRGFSLESVSEVSIAFLSFVRGRNGPFILLRNSFDVFIECNFQNATTLGSTSLLESAAVGIWNSTQTKIYSNFANVTDYAIFLQDSDCHIYSTNFTVTSYAITAINADVTIDSAKLQSAPDNMCMSFLYSNVSIYNTELVNCAAIYKDSQVDINESAIYQDVPLGLYSYISVGDNSILRVTDSFIFYVQLPEPVIQLSSASSQVYFTNTAFIQGIDVLLSITYGEVHFQNCNFSQIDDTVPYTPIILATENSILTFNSCHFSNLKNYILVLNSTLFVTSSMFIDNKVVLDGSAITAINSNVTIANSLWNQAYGGTGVLSAYGSNVSIYNTTFDKTFGIFSAATLFLSSNTMANIQNCTFTNSVAISAPIYAINTNLTILSCYSSGNTGTVAGFALILGNTVATMINSTIDSNLGEHGGVFFLNGALTVINSTLSNNRALFQGGVVYVSPSFIEDILPPSVTFYGNDIYENRAGSGGVIYMDRGIKELNDSGSKYRNNSASDYGDIIATAPSSLYVSQVPPASAIPGITTLGNFSVTLLDQFNQTARTISEFAYLKIGTKNIGSSYFGYSGTSEFDPNTVLFGPPGTTTEYTLFTSIPGLQQLTYPVALQQCPPGWIPQEYQCIPCPSGTYGYNGITCTKCPENAICGGGAQVETLAGYWYDPSIVPYALYQCPYHSCVGNNTCQPHHTGPVCAMCEPGYYNWGAGCVVCTKLSAIFVAIAFVAAILIIALKHLEGGSSDTLGIAIFYFQTLVAFSASVHFGYFALINLQFGTTTSSSSSGFLQSKTFCPGQFGFYDRHYFMYLIPLILCGLSLVVFVVLYLLVKFRIKETLNTAREFGALVGIFDFLYFPVTKNAYSIMFCTKVATVHVLASNHGVECSGYQYSKAVNVAAVVLAITSAIPFALFIFLTYMRKKLENDNIKRIWGGFYAQYKVEFYFWISVQKALQYALSIIISAPLQRALQSFLFLVIILAMLVLHLKFQPFREQVDNKMCTLSLTLLFIYVCFLDNDEADTWQYVVLLCGVIFGIVVLYVMIPRVISLCKQARAKLVSCCCSKDQTSKDQTSKDQTSEHQTSEHQTSE